VLSSLRIKDKIIVQKARSSTEYKRSGNFFSLLLASTSAFLFVVFSFFSSSLSGLGLGFFGGLSGSCLLDKLVLFSLNEFASDIFLLCESLNHFHSGSRNFA